LDFGCSLEHSWGTPAFLAANRISPLDYFALRKAYQGARCVFSESPNPLNPASHCDIAWAGALSTHAHTHHKVEAGAMVC